MGECTFFEKSWREGNFLVPEDAAIRGELLKKMQRAFHSGKAWLPEQKAALRILGARIVLIEAYNNALQG